MSKFGPKGDWDPTFSTYQFFHDANEAILENFQDYAKGLNKR
jgi:hypothetical protein